MLYAQISASSNGDNTLVAAVTGRRIVVTGLLIMAANTVAARFYSGPSANSVPLTGSLPLVAQSIVNGAPVPPQLGTPAGHFVTNQGDALVLNLGGAVAVTGWLTYELIA